MHRIEDIKKTLIGWVENEVAKGRECFDVCAAGQVVDMIKDLAEAEEDCIKAAYYSTIMDAMNGSEEHTKRYGYDNWRYSSSGRFAPKGHGSYDGYTPFNENVRVHNPNMSSEIRMGYPMDGRDIYDIPRYDQNGGWSEKGRKYDEYKNAKRHYHETKKAEDMTEMNRKMGENLSNIITQLREMADDANPEMRKKLKLEMAAVMDDLNKMM